MADLTQTALQPELTARSGLPAASGAWARPLMRRWTRRVDAGTLDVAWQGVSTWRQTGCRPGFSAQIHVNNPRFVRRAALGGALGFADSYVDGDWDSPDLTALFKLAIDNEASLSATLTQSFPAALLARLQHWRHANTLAGSRRNIAAHYDLGNDFYAAWLDDTMTYSSGIFSGQETSLEAAQESKYVRIAQMAGLRRGDHVLEIGCGWGGFAMFAAQRFGCRVTALTLSRAQADWARRAIADAGLADRIEVRLQDYRQVTGTFDRIVSIEMFEAVGEAYWADFFAALRAHLKPGGGAALQVITIDETRFDHYRRNPDFIQMRVFPGGMLPSPAAFAAAAEAQGLAVTDTFDFGASYAETLRRWRAGFEAAWPQFERQGFDERFRRLWRYYLCYCEAGFDAGAISVGQFRLEAA